MSCVLSWTLEGDNFEGVRTTHADGDRALKNIRATSEFGSDLTTPRELEQMAERHF